MFKWLVLVVGAYLLYRWVRTEKQIHKNRSVIITTHVDSDDKATEPQAMVPCHYCKVHLPQDDAIVFDRRFYCTPEHLNAFDEQGWVGFANWRYSPNQDSRPENAQIDIVVIHHISLPPGQFLSEESSQNIIDFFQNRLNPNAHPYFAEIANQKVSSHFLITRSGELVQFVSTQNKAWHAGISSFMGRDKCNDFSIGIELEGNGDCPFEEVQYQTLVCLVKKLEASYPKLQFAGHSDIAPSRKTDPGVFFDWKKFHEEAAIPAEKMPFGLISR